MVHKLAIVAVIGLSASAVCMGAAAAIGGNEFGKGFDGVDLSMFGDRPRCERIESANATSREMAWDDSDRVSLSVGGHATYTPGTDNKVHASGNPQTLAHLRVRDGKIELDCNGHLSRDLQITLPGREFKKFGIAGSGNIKADGKVEHTEIHIAGSGDVDTTHVEARITEVHIAGSGNTDIAPTDEADIHVAGSGDVNLHTNPKKLETHIAGSGRIHNVGAGG